MNVVAVFHVNQPFAKFVQNFLVWHKVNEKLIVQNFLRINKDHPMMICNKIMKRMTENVAQKVMEFTHIEIRLI